MIFITNATSTSISTPIPTSCSTKLNWVSAWSRLSPSSKQKYARPRRCCRSYMMILSAIVYSWVA